MGRIKRFLRKLRRKWKKGTDSLKKCFGFDDGTSFEDGIVKYRTPSAGGCKGQAEVDIPFSRDTRPVLTTRLASKQVHKLTEVLGLGSITGRDDHKLNDLFCENNQFTDCSTKVRLEEPLPLVKVS